MASLQFPRIIATQLDSIVQDIDLIGFIPPIETTKDMCRQFAMTYKPGPGMKNALDYYNKEFKPSYKQSINEDDIYNVRQALIRLSELLHPLIEDGTYNFNDLFQSLPSHLQDLLSTPHVKHCFFHRSPLGTHILHLSLFKYKTLRFDKARPGKQIGVLLLAPETLPHHLEYLDVNPPQSEFFKTEDFCFINTKDKVVIGEIRKSDGGPVKILSNSFYYGPYLGVYIPLFCFQFHGLFLDV